jgi:hypothetical protein
MSQVASGSIRLDGDPLDADTVALAFQRAVVRYPDKVAIQIGDGITRYTWSELGDHMGIDTCISLCVNAPTDTFDADRDCGVSHTMVDRSFTCWQAPFVFIRAPELRACRPIYPTALGFIRNIARPTHSLT